MVCFALISVPYIIRHLSVGLHVKAMSDSAEENGSGNDSDEGTEEEFVLHQGRSTCDKVARINNCGAKASCLDWRKCLSIVVLPFCV